MSRALDFAGRFNVVTRGMFDALATRPGQLPPAGESLAVQLENTLISSLVGDRDHGDLLDSLAPPAGWDLRQSTVD